MTGILEKKTKMGVSQEKEERQWIIPFVQKSKGAVSMPKDDVSAVEIITLTSQTLYKGSFLSETIRH